MIFMNESCTHQPHSIIRVVLWCFFYMLLLFRHSVRSLCDPVNCSRPGSPDLHLSPKRAQTHAQRVGDAIQPSRPLSSPSSALSVPQHQGLFQGVSSSHQVTKVLQLQHQSFQ